MTNNNTQAIKDAQKIIERFGGIRPMAKKLGIAVTTIQGWKKRNVIPATRYEQILEAATSYSIDLSDIIQVGKTVDLADNENNNENKNDNDFVKVVSGTFEKDEKPKVSVQGTTTQKQASDLDARLAATEKKAVTKSTWINVMLIVIVVVSIVVLLWPSSQEVIQNEGRLNILETDVDQLRGDVDAVRSEQSFLSTLIPQDLDQRIANLQEQARSTQKKLGEALDKVGEISNDVLGENAGSVSERIAVIENHVSDLTSSSQITDVLNKFKKLGETVGGQQQLSSTVSELNSLIFGLGGEDDGQFEQMLSVAREKSSTLNQTFDGVPAQELKAAALLLGMTQFRQSLNRDNQPFDQDLQLLINLMGKDNPELVDSLQRLSPHAEQGILTLGGLTDEFKILAGDAVVASLRGEDVAFSEKAKARLNEVLQIEKDGELITGIPVQATVLKAESLLKNGDIVGAIEQMEALDGAPREAMEPWLNEAKATMLAQQLKDLMGQGVKALSNADFDFGGSQFIHNEETGILILKPGLRLKPYKAF
ncbi:MAG: hypothetical protein KAJ86_03870 [Alphaproteobacteria bacterium]|nr:hypothetical protein [Alphaproteobacteria bacterium]